MHTAELDWITPDAERVVARHARVSTADPDRAEFEKLLSIASFTGIGVFTNRRVRRSKLLLHVQYLLK